MAALDGSESPVYKELALDHRARQCRASHMVWRDGPLLRVRLTVAVRFRFFLLQSGRHASVQERGAGVETADCAKESMGQASRKDLFPNRNRKRTCVYVAFAENVEVI